MPPAYDYQALVDGFFVARQNGQLAKAIAQLETLSGHCPMTPLLWMHYSRTVQEWCDECQANDDKLKQKDPSSDQLPRQIIDLGLLEFPGSALLWCYKVQCLDPGAAPDAIQAIGQGSHYNEDCWILPLFVAWAEHTKDPHVFLERAACPMKQSNASIVDDLQAFCVRHSLPLNDKLIQNIETARRTLAHQSSSERQEQEDNLDWCMQKDGVLGRYEEEWKTLDWDTILQPRGDVRYGMGLGSMATASAVCRYYKTFDYNAQIMERGLAECPTVESVWKLYLQNTQQPALVSKRAFRNCPYSVYLFTKYLQHCNAVDADELLTQVSEGLDLGFIPQEQHIDIYLVALQIIQKKLLLVLANENESVLYSSTKKLPESSTVPLTEEAQQEAEDLLEDLEDMVEQFEAKVKKVAIAKRRLYEFLARSETLFVRDIRCALSSDTPTPSLVPNPHWDKAIKASNPTHPDTYWNSIRQIIHQPVSQPRDIITKLQYVRGLFETAVIHTGCPQQQTWDRDYHTALSNLTHEWRQWEALVGNESTRNKAQKVIAKKMQKAELKRVRPEGGGGKQERPSKRPKVQDSSTNASTMEVTRDEHVDTSMEAEPEPTSSEVTKAEPSTADRPNDSEKTNSTATQPVQQKEESTGVDTNETNKPIQHKVLVGTVEYPAHPFTVRVSNLHVNVQDMDLVDAFRPKCGPIVHAKIMRNHHTKESKGWGLIQFEDKDSVESALALNNVLGLQEQIVTVSRAHMPAASLVPPGWHRVQKRGEGKFSKRNEKRKQPSKPALDKKAKNQTAPTGSVLAFQPRSVARVGRKAKVKIDLGHPTKPKES